MPPPRNVFSKLFVIVGQQIEPAKYKAGHKKQKQSWKYSLDASAVERGKTEGMTGQIANNDRGDQISGNHEEDINAEKAALNGRGERMKRNDSEHSNRPQAIHVPAVFDLFATSHVSSLPSMACGPGPQAIILTSEPDQTAALLAAWPPGPAAHSCLRPRPAGRWPAPGLWTLGCQSRYPP